MTCTGENVYFPQNFRHYFIMILSFQGENKVSLQTSEEGEYVIEHKSPKAQILVGFSFLNMKTVDYFQ